MSTVDFARNGLRGREVHCACVTDDDRITVYRTAGTEPISAGLDQDGDFVDSLWLFDGGDRGRNQIAVRFYEDDGRLTADLFQDHDGDGQVSTREVDGQVAITEPGTWSVRSVALDGYWQRDGRLAQNFDISVDDRFMAAFGGENYQDAMANDGIVDVVVHVRGPRQGDPRSYDWRNVYSPVSASSAIFRTVLMVREQGLEPPLTPVFPWYLLGKDVGLVKGYGTSESPIQVDWQAGKLVFLGEFVASRGSDENWFTYSLNRIEPGATVDPDFESPFAFYDLADDHDSVPELQVRAERYIQDDPFSPAPYAADQAPFQQIRYSWDQDNTQHWSYKLGLLGRNQIDGSVTFPDFTLKTVPYASFPTWVTENRWDVASFVAAEKPMWTTEGIYDLDPSGQVRNAFYSGLSTSDGDFGSQVDLGRRAEYTLHLEDQPWLYVSAIDHKLHLEEAEAGIWNIDGRRELHYLNDSGGSTFDGWELWTDGRVTARLYRVTGGLLYSDDTTTLYLPLDIASELFRTLPPTNHDEWQQLGAQLHDNARPFADGDLRAMFDQFGGDPIALAKGGTADFVRSQDGFTITVPVADGTTRYLLSSLTGTPVSNGLQTVMRNGSAWSVQPAAVTGPVVDISVEPGSRLDTAPVTVTVANPGSLRLSGATLTLQAVAEDGKTGVPLGNAELDIASGGQQVVPFSWAPGRSGNWTLRATITRDSVSARTGAQVTLYEQQRPVTVAATAPMAAAAAGQLGWAGGLGTRTALGMALLLLAGLAAGAVLWRGLRLA